MEGQAPLRGIEKHDIEVSDGIYLGLLYFQQLVDWQEPGRRWGDGLRLVAGGRWRKDLVESMQTSFK